MFYPTIALLLLNCNVSGFVVPSSTNNSFQTKNRNVSSSQRIIERIPRNNVMQLHSFLDKSNNGNNEFNEDSQGGEFDVEAARQKLEYIMGGGRESSRSSSNNSITTSSSAFQRLTVESLKNNPPPPMSETTKEKKLIELHLLHSLQESDEALSDIWSHWFAEQGAEPAAELLRGEELASRGEEYFAEAEQIFRDLIASHGLYWVEPINRLATLLYRQDRLQESKECCELVLTIKPWHFGALSGIVLVCTKTRDMVNAKMWADRRLPAFQASGDNSQRKQWVNRVVSEATRSIFNPQDFGGFTVEEGEDDDGQDIDDRNDVDGISLIEGISVDDSEDSWQ